MKCAVLASLTATATALHPWTPEQTAINAGTCVAPGTCTPPNAKYHAQAGGAAPGNQVTTNTCFLQFVFVVTRVFLQFLLEFLVVVTCFLLQWVLCLLLYAFLAVPVVFDVTCFQQWNINGGFCGAWSTQQSALRLAFFRAVCEQYSPCLKAGFEKGMLFVLFFLVTSILFLHSVGAWISQDYVRKANRDQTGIEHNMHGSTIDGYEVMPSNVAYTAKALKLDGVEWDYMQASPQAPAFKTWLKSHLVKGRAIVWFPLCKGDSHSAYPGSVPNGGQCDHVEPM